jgi:hypothetical protein
MRARHLLALFAASLTAVVAVGCGGETTGSGGSGGSGGGEGGEGGGTTTSASTTSASTSDTTSTTTTTTTSNTGDGNENFDQAEEITLFDGQVDELTVGELDPIETDNDFFKFEGTAGDAVLISTVAKTDPNSPGPFADGYPDLVITLFDSNQQQIAQNDDPIPRNTQDSTLYTVLPSTGTYYIRVEEFCQVLGLSSPNCDQAYFDSITERLYGLFAAKLDPASDGNVGEPATDNDMPYEVAPSEFVENNDGTGFFAISFQGTFKAAADEDVYTFTLPTTFPTAQGRDTSNFELFPTGVDGNGSTVPTGLVWITDSADNVIAQVDGTKLDPIDGYPISAPLTLGETYQLHVQSSGTPGANPFYYVLHYQSGSNDVEMDDMGNNVITTPESVAAVETAGGFPAGFFAGNLLVAAGDEDHFLIEAAPNAGDFLYVTCSAQRAGSGLRQFKATAYNADTGMAIAGATATETDTAQLSFGDQGVALGGATSVIVKVEAGMQDPVVLGNYYQCGVVFLPPM